MNIIEYESAVFHLSIWNNSIVENYINIPFDCKIGGYEFVHIYKYIKPDWYNSDIYIYKEPSINIFKILIDYKLNDILNLRYEFIYDLIKSFNINTFYKFIKDNGKNIIVFLYPFINKNIIIYEFQEIVDLHRLSICLKSDKLIITFYTKISLYNASKVIVDELIFNFNYNMIFNLEKYSINKLEYSNKTTSNNLMDLNINTIKEIKNMCNYLGVNFIFNNIMEYQISNWANPEIIKDILKNIY